MYDAFWAAFLRPFVLVALHALVVWWVARIVWHFLPDGWFRSFLFRRRGLCSPPGRRR